ncbi:MAG TPA: VOC family protein [Rhizomicrobium sp.]|jgi:lactoylglutathione lyase
MRYLHTMVRVKDLGKSLHFYCELLGLKEMRRIENEKGRFTLVFLAAPEDAPRALMEQAPMVELTYNWDQEDYAGGRNFGHLAYHVNDIYESCARLMAGGATINRPPRDGHMAFVRSPDGISIELLQKGAPKAPSAPWNEMPNVGSW